MRILIVRLLSVASVLLCSVAVATAQTEPSKPQQRAAAIFVKNRSKTVPDEKVGALQDLLDAKVSEQGLTVISRDTMLNAVSSFANAGGNRGDASGPGAGLDQILSNNTSALRLAQNINADYILCATIVSFDRSSTDFRGNGISSIVTTSTLTISYTLADAVEAKSVAGGTVEATDQVRQQPGLTDTRDPFNTLMKDAAAKLADMLARKLPNKSLPEIAQQPGKRIEFSVAADAGDLTIPEVMKETNGEYVVTANRYTIQAMNVNVEVDGIVVGTTPGPLQALPGIHKMRLTRDGFKDWQQTANLYQGMTLKVSLQMTDAGYARWKESAAFLDGLKANSKLTDAQVKAWEGFAKMLSQSSLYVPVLQSTAKREAYDFMTTVGVPTAPTTNPAQPQPQ